MYIVILNKNEFLYELLLDETSKPVHNVKFNAFPNIVLVTPTIRTNTILYTYDMNHSQELLNSKASYFLTKTFGTCVGNEMPPRKLFFRGTIKFFLILYHVRDFLILFFRGTIIFF